MFRKKTAFSLIVAVLVAIAGDVVRAQSTAEATAGGEKKPEKIYELRIYKTNPGKLPDLHTRFRDHTMKLFEKHGMENVIYWTLTEDFKDESKDNTLVYLLAHKNKEAAEASWKAFLADPEWQDVAAKSEENGKLLASAPVSVFLQPTDFSPPDGAANAKSDKPARLFELRRYNDGEARVPATVGRFKEWEGELFRNSGIETLDFWTTEDGSAFVYLLGHKDRETADKNWQTFFTGFRGRNANAAKGGDAKSDAAKGEAAKGGDAAKSADAVKGSDAKAAKGNRGGGGGGGIERRWLVPTDYSPRK